MAGGVSNVQLVLMLNWFMTGGVSDVLVVGFNVEVGYIAGGVSHGAILSPLTLTYDVCGNSGDIVLYVC